jgi:hypothetical protein
MKCCICQATALYRVQSQGFCAKHRNQAKLATARENCNPAGNDSMLYLRFARRKCDSIENQKQERL